VERVVKLGHYQKLRQHPDDPNVWEITTDTLRKMGHIGSVCRGCPYLPNLECPILGDERSCRSGTVWYGEHILIANKLEGA
jgi:hypothetical protein